MPEQLQFTDGTPQPDSLSAFVDLDDAPQLPVVDRSTLERYSICPAQARLCEAGLCLPVGIIAEVGEAGHKAIGEAVNEYILSHRRLE